MDIKFLYSERINIKMSEEAEFGNEWIIKQLRQELGLLVKLEFENGYKVIKGVVEDAYGKVVLEFSTEHHHTVQFILDGFGIGYFEEQQ